MRDRFGNELKEGDTVLIFLVAPQILCKVSKVEHGGLVLGRVGNKPPGETLDKLDIVFTTEMQLGDARSGERHSTVIKCCDSTVEQIVKLGN